MTDSALRDAERRAATGSLEDRVRVLVARLRSAPGCEKCGGRGRAWVDLARAKWRREEPCPACAGTGCPLRGRIELGAYCGDEAARAALGSDWPDKPWGRYTTPDGRAWEVPPAGRGASPESDAWLSGLSRWADIQGTPGWILVRAAVAAARVAWERWASSGMEGSPRPRTNSEGPLRAIEAAEEWLVCPCDMHADLVGDRCSEIGPRTRFAHSLMHLFNDYGRDHYTRDVIEDSAAVAGESAVRATLSSALSSWALETP